MIDGSRHRLRLPEEVTSLFLTEEEQSSGGGHVGVH
jgi:hypothetical protein